MSTSTAVFKDREVAGMTKLRIEQHLARKSPELRAALVAIGQAVDSITAEYAREEEVKPWLESLIRAQEKTARGGYVGEQLRKIHDRLEMHADNSKPEVIRAIQTIRVALHRAGWLIWENVQ